MTTTETTARDAAWTVYESPLGPLTLIGGPDGLSSLRFPASDAALGVGDAEALRPALDQLDQYFAGDRRRFDLDLDLRGTPFQLSAWQLLREIPYGTTTTYACLADALGRRDRVRAVGAAVGRTPVPIFVPCHRVLGSDGSLTGYGGGLPRKRALLDLEANVARGLAPEAPWTFRQMTLTQADL
jgi:methylated-DNA-[protein]-cysteine S-methyltransferase